MFLHFSTLYWQFFHRHNIMEFRRWRSWSRVPFPIKVPSVSRNFNLPSSRVSIPVSRSIVLKENIRLIAFSLRFFSFLSTLRGSQGRETTTKLRPETHRPLLRRPLLPFIFHRQWRLNRVRRF